MTRGAQIERKCQRCKDKFMARVADVNRGWAKFCSKSCKAKEQEKRTGQCANYLNNFFHGRRCDEEDENTFSNAHQFDNCYK